MSNFEADLAALVSKRAASARGAALLSLTGALLGDPSPQITVAPRSDLPRFINLDANAKPTDGDHVAVWQPATDIVWTAAPLADDVSPVDAMKLAIGCTLFNQTTWRGPDILQLQSIIDFDLFEPCVDKKHFKGPYGWTWSRTPYPGAAGAFRGVSLVNGGGNWCSDYSRGRALAVLAGQQLGLRL